MMTSPRICIFTETYYPVVGGGETQARLLAENLIANGSPVVILTRRSDASLESIERYGEVTVHRLQPTGRGQHKKWGLLFSSIPRLFQLRRQYDLIFVSGFRIVGVSAVLVSKLLGKACVLKADSQGEMSGDFFDAGLDQLGLPLLRIPFGLFLIARDFILRRANAFAAITRDIAAELSAKGVDNERIFMIPNSVDTELFTPVDQRRKQDLRRTLGLPESNTTVIYTGRLVSYKGLPLLLEVWRELQRKRNNVTLLLVGTGGLDIHNCEDALKTYVAENDLQDSVCFTGSVRNVPEYLQASDIYVLPTENDAFPSALIEAMACGLPAVTTPIGAIKTIIRDKQNGLLVEPGDFQQLYDALDKLIADTTMSEHLGKAAWQVVQERYSAEIVTQEYIDLFGALVNQPDSIPEEAVS